MIKSKFYSFSGRDENNKLIRGTIDAPNQAFAHYLALKIGLRKIHYLSVSISSYKRIFSLSMKEKLDLFSQISLQIKSGISILDSLNNLKTDTNSFKMKYILYIILKNLNDGHSLSTSLKKFRYSPFSQIELGLIKSAEASGALDTSFEFICINLENRLTIYQKIVSALIYPCITLAISGVVTLILFKWIIPQFEVIFAQNQHALPWITELIFSISKNINFICLILLLGSFFTYSTLRFLITHHVFSDKFLEQCCLKTPLIGPLSIMTNRINFCYTLAMLLGAGVSIHDALSEANDHVALPYSKTQLQQAFKELVAGKTLATVLKKSHFFPNSAIQTITAAENSGRLQQAFKLIGQQFTNDLSIFSDHLSKVIEPFIIILLGAIIGTIVIAIYLPIFQLGSLY